MVVDLSVVRATTPVPTVEIVQKLVRIDLGCGQNKREGFVGVDLHPATGVDIVHDLLSYPWPFEDESIDELHCSHFLEHIPGKLRFRFMDEVWRVLKTNSQILFVTPTGDRHNQDPTHEHPEVTAAFYQLYLSRDARIVNKLTHGAYDIKCNFSASLGVSYHPNVAARSDQFREFAGLHYRNAYLDLYVTLTKLP